MIGIEHVNPHECFHKKKSLNFWLLRTYFLSVLVIDEYVSQGKDMWANVIHDTRTHVDRCGQKSAAQENQGAINAVERLA